VSATDLFFVETSQYEPFAVHRIPCRNSLGWTSILHVKIVAPSSRLLLRLFAPRGHFLARSLLSLPQQTYLTSFSLVYSISHGSASYFLTLLARLITKIDNSAFANNMFAASASSLQAEPVYPKNFADLGCTINSKSQIVQVSNEQEFIPYHISSDERESEIRMEAVHFCVRKAVAAAAASMGVREVFLTGGGGDVIMSTKPRGPHLRIFTSDLEHLKGKKNVLVVIGEHDQDPGIWKWKHVMTEGGIDGGTMVGLMQSLTKMIVEGAGLEEAIGSEQTTEGGEAAQAG